MLSLWITNHDVLLLNIMGHNMVFINFYCLTQVKTRLLSWKTRLITWYSPRDLEVLVFASTTNLELGPHFAKICYRNKNPIWEMSVTWISKASTLGATTLTVKPISWMNTTSWSLSEAAFASSSVSEVFASFSTSSMDPFSKSSGYNTTQKIFSIAQQTVRGPASKWDLYRGLFDDQARLDHLKTGLVH